MLTDFGIARMTQYTQAFFQTTTRDATAGSVRWTAYELFPLDLQSGPEESSSEEELLPRMPIAERIYNNLVVPSTSGGEGRYNATSSPKGGLSEIKIGEDEDSEGHHTKGTDIWAFGMVIYVRGFIISHDGFISF